jgi:hypothetical protein
MPENGLTGLTGSEVNGPREGKRVSQPVRPVRKRKMTGSDGSAGYIGTPRRRAERKAANPSDPSGSGTAAEAVQEMTGSAVHLAATQRIRISYIICDPGEPLCGTPKPLQPSLDALFAPAVTCWLCLAIARRDGITITGSSAAA